MGIISISINDRLLKEIDRLEKEQGYSGRSEVIRAGLRLLISEEKEKSRLTGEVEGTVIVVNEEKYNEEISLIRHEFNNIIKTQIHNHLDSHKCLQIFVIRGSAAKVKELVKKFQTSKKTEYVKLFAY
jgi:CopG family transcriptional regulator, nickel-responsive regulator